MQSFGKIKWLMKYTILRRFLTSAIFRQNQMANEIHNLEKVLVYLKCLPTCRIHEHLNIKTAVNFAVNLLNSTKFPEMEILGFLEKVYNGASG